MTTSTPAATQETSQSLKFCSSCSREKRLEGAHGFQQAIVSNAGFALAVYTTVHIVPVQQKPNIPSCKKFQARSPT
jgi:hypothetical protein